MSSALGMTLVKRIKVLHIELMCPTFILFPRIYAPSFPTSSPNCIFTVLESPSITVDLNKLGSMCLRERLYFTSAVSRGSIL